MNTHFSNNFWESLEKNGITVLLDRMRGAKQTCERLKNSYEARVLLEEEYSKTLLQISQKQKVSSTENGSSKLAMDKMQAESQCVAESHMQLSCHLKDNIIIPLTKLINKQKTIRKELQTSVQKLYNNRQLQVHFVRKAHKRHNQEIEKANALVEQKKTEEDKQAAFKMAQPTIEKLKNVYDEGLKDLSKIVEEWNTEWKKTCESFEKLEQERIEFFASNLSNYANLMIGCLENEVQAYERANASVKEINVSQDLVDFVNENKSTHIVPTPMDYVKLHAYNEANKDRGGADRHTFHSTMDHEEHSDTEDHDDTKENTQTKTDTISQTIPLDISTEADDIADDQTEVESPSVMMIGKMEVYGSDEEDSDSEYVYVTDSEFEEEEGEEKKGDGVLPEPNTLDIADEPQLVEKPVERPRIQTVQNRSTLEERGLYKNHISDSPTSPIRDGSSILLKKGLSARQRVSFSGGQRPYEMNGETLAEKVNRVVSSDSVSNDTININQEEAATELDNMLRELDSSHRSRSRNIRPTASASSPGILQDRKSSYFNKKDAQRVSPIDTDKGSRRFSRDLQQRILSPKSPDSLSQSPSTVSSGDFYDPFYSLSSSSRSANTINSDGSIKPTKSTSTSAPTAQMIYERMLKNGNMDSYRRRRSSINTDTVSLGSVRSRESLSSITQDLYNAKPAPENKEQFVDFAIAQYDYEAADEGEISFHQGDLLGIISKGDSEDEQGWWEASLLDKRNQKVVRTGLVPSNFIETASRA